MSEMIEKVARTVALQWFGSEKTWRNFVPAARAAIEALREPTQAMEEAGAESQADDCFTLAQASMCFRAMVSQALTEGEG